MGRLLSAAGIMVVLLGVGSPAWSFYSDVSGQVGSQELVGFRSLAPIREPVSQPGVIQTAFTSNVLFPPIPTPRLRDLAPEEERPRIQQLLATTTWFQGKVATETEIAQSHSGLSWLTRSTAENMLPATSSRMIRFGLTGSEGHLRYGFTFRQAGQSFLVMPDRASREVWSEWKMGWMTYRNAVGQSWNNVDGNFARSRTEQTYGRIGIALEKPSWPDVSLTYVRNSFVSMLDPRGMVSLKPDNHMLEGALAIQRPTWNLRLASSYVLARETWPNGGDSSMRIQSLSATLRPMATLTITPTIAYRQEFHARSGAGVENPMASLALSYDEDSRLQFSMNGNYASSRSSDGMMHTEHIRGRGVVAWVVYTSAEWTTKITFEAGYNRFTNRSTRATDIEDISGLIRLAVAAR